MSIFGCFEHISDIKFLYTITLKWNQILNVTEIGDIQIVVSVLSEQPSSSHTLLVNLIIKGVGRNGKLKAMNSF